MPRNEPDHTDPMELTGVAFDDPTGQSVRVMAECFADEFLRLGHTSAQVMDLFRSTEHQLAHIAWQQLGEVHLYALVQEIARRNAVIRESLLHSRASRDLTSKGA